VDSLIHRGGRFKNQGTFQGTYRPDAVAAELLNPGEVIELRG
jgi:hypothetical protein